MNLKQFFSDIPGWKIIALLISMSIAGFEGVILSQVISTVTKFNSNNTSHDIINLILYALISYLLVQLASMMVDFLNNNILSSLNQKYKLLVLKSIYSSKNVNKSVGDSLTILTVDLKVIEENYFAVILGSIYYLIMGLVSLLYLVYLSPLVSLLFIVFSFFPTIPTFLFSNFLESATEVNVKKNNKFIKNITDFIQGYSEILTYNSFTTFFERTKNIIKDLESSSKNLRNKHSFVRFLTAIFSWLSYIIPISIALILVINDKLDAAVIVALFLANDRVVTPFRNLSEYLRMFSSTGAIRNKVNEIIGQGNNTSFNVKNKNLAKPNIIIDKLSFGYEDDIFKNETFEIPFGSKVLVTGVSGSGKTTFLNLLQGILPPNDGQIFYEDVTTKEKSEKQLMSRIQQDPYYFELSLLDNILMGLEPTEYNIKRTYDILQNLGLIRELGEDCLTNKYGEQGNELSGGQKQRIEIARALIHDRKILLVDEATSAIDSNAALSIRKILSDLDVTVIEVAHHYDDSYISNLYTHRIELGNGKMKFYKI